MQNTRKINILMIIPWMEMGGSDRFNLSIVEKIDKSVFSVSIVCTVQGNNRWKHFFDEHVKEIYILPEFLEEKEYADFILNLIKKQNIDAIFLSNSYYGYYLLPLIKCTFPKIAVIDYVHMAEWYWRNGGYARLSGMSECCIDQTLVCNHQTGQVLTDMFSRKKETVETLYIGVDQNRFDCDKVPYGEIRAKYQIEENRKIILFPCRIHPQKRPFLMLEIAEKVISQNKNVCFFVAGDGPQYQELTDQIRKRKLSKWFICPGEISEMEKVYRDSDLTLICSIKEGLSLTAYESCAMATPVISADVGGQKELIDHSVGRLIPLYQDETEIDSRDYAEAEINAYSEAILDILQDQNQYDAMCRKCREKITSQFSTDVMIGRLEQIILATIEKARNMPQERLFPSSMIGLATNYLTTYLEFETASNPQNRDQDINQELKRIANSRLGKLAVNLMLKLKINRLFR